MKRLILAALLLATFGASTGCCLLDRAACGRGCGRMGLLRRNRCQTCDDGGATAAHVTYPYYTNRGPRDFLARSPRGIGP